MGQERRNQLRARTLFQRLMTTLALVGLVRLGTLFPVPGIHSSDITVYLAAHPLARNIVTTFSGRKLFTLGLFTLNIFPYINASILTQFLVGFIPQFSKLQKEGDFNSRQALSQLTRWITFLWAILQSTSLALYLRSVLFNWSWGLACEIILWLTTGAMIVLWVSELITTYGIGNGASLLIYTNIISNLPNLTQKIVVENNETLPVGVRLLLGGVVILAFYGILVLQEAYRLIPLVSSKQLMAGRKVNPKAIYLPLRLNQAGVMPLILTTAFLVIPNYLSQIGWLPRLPFPGVFYWMGYFGLILFFSSYYTKLVLNPKDLSDNLQRMAVVIPGIKPGRPTTLYLKRTLNRLALLGAILLATIVILPNFLVSKLSLNSLNNVGTTSLLIVVGVVLEVGRQVKDLSYSTRYQSKS